MTSKAFLGGTVPLPGCFQQYPEQFFRVGELFQLGAGIDRLQTPAGLAEVDRAEAFAVVEIALKLVFRSADGTLGERVTEKLGGAHRVGDADGGVMQMFEPVGAGIGECRSHRTQEASDGESEAAQPDR